MMNLIKKSYYFFTYITKHFSEIKIGDSPFMTEKETEAFLKLLSNTKTYLEYGSGGSTVLAAKYVENLISVDNDKRYIEKLQEKIEHNQNHQLISLNFASLGPSGYFGAPFYTPKNNYLANLIKNYTVLPWQALEKEGLEPELILIDGRCRVASVLESLARLSNKEQVTFFIHDYSIRSHFHVIEELVDKVEQVDTAFIFKPKVDMDMEMLAHLQEEYRYEWR